MGKRKSSFPSHLPRCPWIFVNDTSYAHEHTTKLASMIPDTVHLRLNQWPSESPTFLDNLGIVRWHEQVLILSVNRNDGEEVDMSRTIRALRQDSIKASCNFASINLCPDEKYDEIERPNSQHLDIIPSAAPEQSSAEDVKTTAYKMYKWLFTVFTVPEQLHIISDRQMTAIDRSSAFKDYAYCPISESRHHPKDAKIQFVALVLTKPEIGLNQRIHWQVADKTGVANFYFHHRGPTSQYTWDWVLALKPGDRKCLPRMPMVKIEEGTGVTIAKFPFRTSAALITGTGHAMKLAGKGLCKVGRNLKLGDRGQWVLEADVCIDSKGKIVKKTHEHHRKSCSFVMPAEEKTEVSVFSDKGEKIWKDDDSVASTTAGSIIGEKKM